MLEPARALEFSFALYDPGVGGLFAVKCLCLAVDDRARFLDDDLGDESLRAVFPSPSNYRAHLRTDLANVVLCRTASQSRGSQSVQSHFSVRLEPEKYDKVVPWAPK